MKRILSVLLTAAMLFSTAALCIESIASDGGAVYSTLPEADIMNLKFADKSITDVSGGKVVASPVIIEYSEGNKAKESFENVGDATFTHDGLTYTEKGFYKTTQSNTAMISFSSSATAYASTMAAGFTLEATFAMPSAGSNPTTWGNTEGTAIIGATNGGGFIIGRTSDGKIFFAIKDSSAYKGATASETYEVGELVHAVCTYDGASISVTVNGDDTATATVSGLTLAAGANAPYIGIGGSIASSTNPTNYACGKDLKVFGLKLYSTALTSKQAKVAFSSYINSLTPTGTVEEKEDKFGEDILDLLFTRDGKVYVTEASIGIPTVKEYSSNGEAKTDFPNVGSTTVTIGGKEYETVGFTPSATTNQIGIDLSAYKTALEAELSDGFSVETSFVVPDVTDGDERYFIGATHAGGFGIGTRNGNLRFLFHDGSWQSVMTALPEAGTFCHVVATYDATAKKITLAVNGEVVGETAVAKFNPGGWFGSISICGSTASATNFTNYPMTLGSTVTSLHIYSDALTEDEAYEKYEEAMGNLGIEVSKAEYVDDFEPVLRFMVTSDVHISSEDDARCIKLANALSDMKRLAKNSGNHYTGFDAVMIVGDIADNGKETQLQWVKDILTSSLDASETQTLITMGNHDYYDGTSAATGSEVAVRESQFDSVYSYVTDVQKSGVTLVASNGAQNTHYIINGYHFINLSVDVNGWQYSQSQLDWLDEQIQAAQNDTGMDKPIFVANHIGTSYTILGTDNDWADGGVTNIDTVLSKYPQVVNFSGHSHAPINNECSVLQTTYTMFGTGSLNYTGGILGDDSVMTMVDKSTYDVAQVYVVEVDADSRTRVRVYDINQNKFVGQTVILDSYKIEDYKYTENYFKDDAEIKFASDAEITVNKITSSLISFSFPVVSEDSFTATYYHIVLEDKNGNAVASRYVRWAYYDEDYSTVLSSGLGGLTASTEYTLKIYAGNNLYNRICGEQDIISEPLVYSFKTAEPVTGDATADLLDIKIDADNKTVTDASANAMKTTVSGSPTIAYDETIGMNTITFDSNSDYVKFSDYVDDADSISYGFTFEAYFKVNEYNTSDGTKSPLGSEQSGGFGFDMYNTGKVGYSIYANGYKTIYKTQETGKYYHWVCSYDGATLVCYVNGHKIGSMTAEAPITYNSIAAMVFYLGADTTGAGNAERQGRVSVAIARLYSLPVDAATATKLWETVRAKQDTSVYVDDSDDPEYLEWTVIDDLDTEYVSFESSDGVKHDHANDSTTSLEYFTGGQLGCFSGSHLYKSFCHFIYGDMSCVLTFTGTAFRYVLYYRGPADGYGNSVNCYIDGEFYKTITDINGNNLTSRYVALEVTGLAEAEHVVTFVSGDGGRVLFDCFEIVLKTSAEETTDTESETTSDAYETESAPYFTVTDSGDMEFHIDGNIGTVTEVKIDGVTVDSSNYTLESGSVVLKLKAEYLETLDGGSHTLTVVFADGTVTANFTVDNGTSSTAVYVIVIAAVVLAVIILVIVLVFKKKKTN